MAAKMGQLDCLLKCSLIMDDFKLFSESHLNRNFTKLTSYHEVSFIYGTKFGDIFLRITKLRENLASVHVCNYICLHVSITVYIHTYRLCVDFFKSVRKMFWCLYRKKLTKFLILSANYEEFSDFMSIHYAILLFRPLC